MKELDFSNIFLSKRDAQHLRSAANGSVILIHPVDAASLCESKMLQPYALGKTEKEFVITQKGLLYIEYMEEVKKKDKLSNIHYWVNTGIALAALLVSIIALLKQ